MGNPYRGNPARRRRALRDGSTRSRHEHGHARCLRDLQPQNTSIYPVDPRGLAVFEYGINEGVTLQQDAADLRSSLDSLHVLANNTEGRAIVNRNDLDVGMRQIMRDSSSYYLLGYNSSEAPTDGKFHEIKVNVKRRGVTSARARATGPDGGGCRAHPAPPKPEAPSAVTRGLDGAGRATRRAPRALLDRDREG
jgi:VWFA-related protein